MDQNVCKGLDRFRKTDQVTSTPHLRDLQNHITPHYATRWIVIGTLLGLPSGTLDVIKYDNHDKAEACCNAMLKKWLAVDPSASWEQLLKVIESPAMTTDQEANAVSLLSERVSQISVQARFAVDEDTWPPNQPKEYTPLLLVHHQGQHTVKYSAALAKLQSGGITSADSVLNCQLDGHESLRKVNDTSKMTKQLTDILAPLEESNDPQFILIEGLPGIGKTLFLQEISYKWSTKKLLQSFKLVLLVQLRNPAVQQASFINELFELFVKGDQNAAEITAHCSNYFFKNAGKGIIFLFDGFDEFPENLQKDSLIASILKRQVLPHCGLVVSSRPHASVNLRQKATVKVDVLGFAEEERKLYIEQSLKAHPQKIKELTDYLESHLTINGLCYVPFIMVALVYLYDQGIPLPTSSTDLYHRFICLTICRHLAKSGHPLEHDVTNFTDFPEPCNTIVKQLAKLSLEALNGNKLIFTLEEVKAACPNIPTIPGAINGYGLLQAVQHFGVTAKVITFNFLHFSIQEFLAAYHITQLSGHKELSVLREKFWSDIHANMFTMYTTFTKGQRPAFKEFLRQPSIMQTVKKIFSRHSHSRDEATVTVSNDFLRSQIKCFRLFRCFHDARDEAICHSIENAKCFRDKVINLNFTSLSPYDMECVALFLTCCSLHKEWKEVNFRFCNIQDHGLRVLHRDLMHSDITIRELNFNGNGLTSQVSLLISDLTIHCGVEILVITNNDVTMGEDLALYDMLSHSSSKLLELYMNGTFFTESTIALFTCLAKRNKLQKLFIDHNLITDEACDVIAPLLKDNTSLVKLSLDHNQISPQATQHLLKTLQHNDTLQDLELPDVPPHYGYSEDAEKMNEFLQEEVNKSRRSRGCQTKLTVHYWWLNANVLHVRM